MSYIGIDYGSIGQSNRDAKTGIHYGVISQGRLMPEALDDMEMYYGEPTCPKCGNEAKEMAGSLLDTEDFELDGTDFACESCKYTFDSQDAYSDEALGFTYDSDGYKLSDCLDSNVFVLCSPYYTYAQFCSPCVPGAGNLDTPLTHEDGAPKTYALGLDWFDKHNPCPYKDNLYLVATGERVILESE